MSFKPQDPSTQKSDRPSRTRQQKSRSPNSKLLNAAWRKAPSIPTRQSQIKAVNHDGFARSWSQWRQRAGECSVEDMEVDIDTDEEAAKSQNKKTSPRGTHAVHQSKSSSTLNNNADNKDNNVVVKPSFSAEDNRQTLRVRRIQQEQSTDTQCSDTTTRKSIRNSNKIDKEVHDEIVSAGFTKKKDTTQFPGVETPKRSKESNALFIIIHVNKVEVGIMKGPATSPVKVYADKFMVQMENESTKKDVSFRVPCKHITSLDVSLTQKPFIIKFTAKEIQYPSGIVNSRKSKGGLKSETVCLHLAYEENVPEEVQNDLKELFQVRLADQKLWPKEEKSMVLPSSTMLQKQEEKTDTDVEREKEQNIKEETSPVSQSSKQVIGNNYVVSAMSVRKRTSIKSKNKLDKEKVVEELNQTKIARRSNFELDDAKEERIKTLSHEAAHYQMVSAQQRMIIQSLEQDVRQTILQSERSSEEMRKERDDISKVLCARDSEVTGLINDLKIQRDLVKALEDQLESARKEIKDKDRTLDEKNDALRVREETILQLRTTMRRHSLSDKDTKKSRDSKEEETVPASAMEETRHYLMQMQLSKQNLTAELEQTRQDLQNRNTDLENLRLDMQDVEEDVQNKNESLGKLRSDFISSQEELVRKNEQVGSLTTELAKIRHDNNIEIDDLRSELASTKAQLDKARSELSDANTEITETQKVSQEHQTFSRDWILERGEISIAENVLGIGAWGNVKVGKFRGTEVAIKQIHLLILSPHNRRLFEREMAIASRCRHPCLVQFIGATNDDGTPLFVMELLDTNLRALLSQEALSTRDCLQLGFDVIRALAYLHQCKPVPIIHRDISSSNVLLYHGKNSWRAKLSDYGAANFMRLSMTRHPGALLYSAPEASTADQTTKLDVYSFGVLFCEMCTRELPVPENRQEQVSSVNNSDYRTLINNCLRRDITKRHASKDVLAVFETWIARLHKVC